MRYDFLMDLHSHTTASDGTYSPEALVMLAKNAGLDMLAITDHDTTKGAVMAQAFAKQQGIRLILGAEVSCQYMLAGGYGKQALLTKTIHVVALNVLDVEQLESSLQRIQKNRALRGKMMVMRLGEILSKKSIYSSITSKQLWHEVLIKANGEPEAVGRAHIAQVLFELGVVKSVQQAFDKYLGDNKPAYVALDGLSMAQAITLIHTCGGLAVLAHPTRYNLSATRIRRLIEDFANLGGDACELPAITEPKSTRLMIDRCIMNHNLLVSVGSDFHGENMPWRKLGVVPKPNANQVGVWTRFSKA